MGGATLREQSSNELETLALVSWRVSDNQCVATLVPRPYFNELFHFVDRSYPPPESEVESVTEIFHAEAPAAPLRDSRCATRTIEWCNMHHPGPLGRNLSCRSVRACGNLTNNFGGRSMELLRACIGLAPRVVRVWLFVFPSLVVLCMLCRTQNGGNNKRLGIAPN